jgi:Bacterial Ig-like domain (group 2)
MNFSSSRLYLRCSAFALTLGLVGCGSSSSGPTPTPSTTITVALNHTSVTVAAGATEQFTATVKGSTNTSVTWSVDGVSRGNSTTGTISSSGLYTAPTVAGSHTVTATSVADTSASAKAAVTVTLQVLNLSPSSALLAPSGTQQFTSTLEGAPDSSVTWSVDGVAGGNAAVGTVSASGLYTAPAAAGNHTISAVSSSDADTKGSASITVASVTLSPGTATIEGSTTQQFTATLQGPSTLTLNWMVDNTVGGSAASGTISTSGLYTAPAQAGNHTISAAATANAAISASALADVFTFAVSPSSATLAPSGTQQFASTIQGLANTAVTWSVDGVAGGNATSGTITSAGFYTAPAAMGPHTVTATSVAESTDSASARVVVANLAASAVLTYHNDDARDGAYLEEVNLTPSNVNSTQFGKLLAYPVDGQIYAQPLYMPAVSIAGGTYDVVFVETQNNSVYAFDADATASNPTTFWHVNLGPPVTVDDSGGPWPNVGILSTPVIDSTTNTMYLVAETLNTGANGTPFFLHALNLLTGADLPGSPVAINATDPNSTATLETSCYQRMGLALNPVTNWIYLAFGSCSHGWLLAYDKSTLAQEAVFNDTSNAAGGGLWAGGGAPAVDDSSGNIYLMSGTDYDDAWISPPPAYTQTGYNDSFLNLNPSTLNVQSSFSPDNNYTLAGNDADLGSGATVLLPGNSQYSSELIGGGKDGNIYIVNPLDMGGFNSTNNVIQSVHTGTQQYNNIFSTPVYWNGSVYYHCDQDVLRAFSWSAGAASGQQLSISPTSMGTVVYGNNTHGATASLSANGATNGIVWDTDNSAYVPTDPSSGGPLVLYAYDATNVANELYNSSQAGSRDTAGLALKFTVPTIANGRVFVPTGTELDIYGLLAP